jgi:RimJ/RimL family protein N-acetyltransferase
MTSSKVHVRQLREEDIDDMVMLLMDPCVMEFSETGALSEDKAREEFARMLEQSVEMPYAEQPIIEPSGRIVGFAGAYWFQLGDQHVLGLHYRVLCEVRGRGYATEAGQQILQKWKERRGGEIFGVIDDQNEGSKIVAERLGFKPWTRQFVDHYTSRPVWRYEAPLAEGRDR